MDYFFKEHEYPGKATFYTVAKFDPDKSVPDEVYTIRPGNYSTSCSCPSRQVPCKHARLVERWLLTNRQVYYDDTSDTFQELFLLQPHKLLLDPTNKDPTNK